MAQPLPRPAPSFSASTPTRTGSSGFHPAGVAGTAVAVVAGAALIGWALDGIVRGNSRFRRALGAVVMIVFVIGLITS